MGNRLSLSKRILVKNKVMASKILSRSIVWSSAAIGLAASAVVAAPANGQSVRQPTQTELDGLGSRLAEMFSPEIRSTLFTCITAGGVNLAASAGGNSVTCGDGSTANVSYAGYLDTASNFFAASFLLGVSEGAAQEPGLTPRIAGSYLAGGAANEIRPRLEAAVANDIFVPANSPESVDLLVDATLQKAAETLNRLDNFGALLGTPEQTSFVVSSFCTAPGMTVTEAQQTVPNLDSTQLYAICLYDAGFAEAIGN